ncbi:family S53 protease-like protein [Trametes versicolor FP-101664 SS1]|uniref:family S53 protease-like protein n=1 Tax=Trametes versicolor (strain FP-101664) TaxID=717944 RepID=UPI0004623B33|nr:family S53 protease-like protein [Trametes versicolor FP-101664 SS1]EIW62698.1 family S53 protease-like protein [Trametes versicolor FP-101664 SS1]
MVAAGLLAFSFFTAALGAPLAREPLHVHDARSAAPQGYTASGAPHPDTVLQLRVALKQSNNAGLIDKLYEVSTPGSQSYRKFLSKSEVEQYVAPSAESLAAVTAWLDRNGVKATPGTTSQWLNIEVPVAKANAMLDTEFSTFEHSDTGVSAIRTLAYSVPASVKPHLDFIYPTTVFPVKATKAMANVHIASSHRHNSTAHTRRAGVDASCDNAMTPACLQALYNVPTTPATQSSNTLAVSSFVSSSSSTADLTNFLGQFRSDVPSSTTFAVSNLDGGVNNEAQTSVEGSLDIQYTVGMATNVPTTFFTVGSDNGGDLGGFLDLVNTLIAQETAPTVLTTSFGFPEALISQDFATNLCNAYAQLGARGTSILFSSGDSGVDDGEGGSCTTFRPTFPSGCPFITVVGATQGTAPETAADLSSGGFSNFFPTPQYQSDAVSSYLTTLGSTNAGLFNKTGRAYPDVSAAGISYQVVINGTVTPVSGTSASTPVFASIIALLNDRLIASGQSTMGFLNPFLYSTGKSALNDITAGSNPGCGTKGFPAEAGWDPVTGLGTPDFNKLLSALKLS